MSELPDFRINFVVDGEIKRQFTYTNTNSAPEFIEWLNGCNSYREYGTFEYDYVWLKYER